MSRERPRVANYIPRVKIFLFQHGVLCFSGHRGESVSIVFAAVEPPCVHLSPVQTSPTEDQLLPPKHFTPREARIEQQWMLLLNIDGLKAK